MLQPVTLDQFDLLVAAIRERVRTGAEYTTLAACEKNGENRRLIVEVNHVRPSPVSPAPPEIV